MLATALAAEQIGENIACDRCANGVHGRVFKKAKTKRV